jgi:hypothetical protein
MSDCNRGQWLTHEEEDDYGHIHTQREWISTCRWKPVTTFRDECTVCGKVFSYPNSNGWPDEKVKESK